MAEDSVLRVVRIEADLRSGKLVKKWTSELTIVRVGMVLYWRPVYSRGRVLAVLLRSALIAQ